MNEIAERQATPNSAAREKAVRAGRNKPADSLGDIVKGGVEARIKKASLGYPSNFAGCLGLGR